MNINWKKQLTACFLSMATCSGAQHQPQPVQSASEWDESDRMAEARYLKIAQEGNLANTQKIPGVCIEWRDIFVVQEDETNPKITKLLDYMMGDRRSDLFLTVKAYAENRAGYKKILIISEDDIGVPGSYPFMESPVILIPLKPVEILYKTVNDNEYRRFTLGHVLTHELMHVIKQTNDEGMVENGVTEFWGGINPRFVPRAAYDDIRLLPDSPNCKEQNPGWMAAYMARKNRTFALIDGNVVPDERTQGLARNYYALCPK